MKPAVLFVFCALSACTIETELFQIETPEDIREVCEEGSTEVFEYLAYFGPQDPGCPWDEGDNQSAAEGQVTARIEAPFSRSPPLGKLKGDTFVVVQPGNSLWLIARRELGGGTRYSVIYNANKHQIKDPDLIYPGQVFAVPKK